MNKPAPIGSGAGPRAIDLVNLSLERRYRRERRFRRFGLVAVSAALVLVGSLFASIIAKGYTAFWQTHLLLEVNLDAQVIAPKGERDPQVIRAANYQGLVKDSVRALFPEVKARNDRRDLERLVSSGASIQIQQLALKYPHLIGTSQKVWVPLDDDFDMLAKGYLTEIRPVWGAGAASPTATTGEVRVLSSANDFAAILAALKVRLAEMAAQAEAELNLIVRRQVAAKEAVILVLQRLERVADQPERVAVERERLTAAQAEAARLTGELERLQAQAAELRSRAEALGGSEELRADMPSFLLEINGGLVRIKGVSNEMVTGEALAPLRDTAEAPAGSWRVLEIAEPEAGRRINDRQIAWFLDLQRRGLVDAQFNIAFFVNGDSREPELAGIGGALLGSLYTLLLTLLLSFPVGVAAAIYLEEFAPKNRWTDLIEVNINNLAAVPSIIFGLLGLAVFINFFGLPRSSSVVGALVLTLLVLPTIIIASRAALKSVPPSIREAALGVGASKVQAIFHHVLPLAMPGMLTGAIIGMAHALGESAPLLMIGMVAFIVDLPGGFTDPATVLPVQVFLWADSPERAFVERTSAAILVLLGFLIAMNAVAVVLRKRFERRW